MGIKSTREIRRSHAINRVLEVSALLIDRNWREIESTSYEDDHEPHEVLEWLEDVAFWRPGDDPEKLTNGQLGTLMDMPYFRSDIFTNYIVINDDESYSY